jgi:hypothetical protein
LRSSKLNQIKIKATHKIQEIPIYFFNREDSEGIETLFDYGRHIMAEIPKTNLRVLTIFWLLLHALEIYQRQIYKFDQHIEFCYY